MSLSKKLDIELSKLLKKEKKSKKHILVLSGGGIKGLAHIGAIQALDELKLLQNIDTIAGSSIGSVISCLLIIGYSMDDLKEFVYVFDMKKIRSIDKQPNILKKFGLDDGKNIVIILSRMFMNKKIDPKITFGDLHKLTGKTLILTVTCLNEKKVYYYSHETHPDMCVITTVRMSISIPLYYTPYIHDGKMYVDGACIDNYPIQLFRDRLDEVIGLYISTKKEIITEITNIEDYISSMIWCLFEGIAINSLNGYEKQTINMNLEDINILDYELTAEKKELLIIEGYKHVMKYFEK